MTQSIKRRQFITLLGGAAAAWPLGALAQQRPAMPVVGVLSGVSLDPIGGYADRVAALHQGLRESGFVEGQNVAIEYRSAEGQIDRLPALAADLVRRRVAVIVGIGTGQPTQAARAATSTIPIVFAFGGDPVNEGLVASLNRPGANVTGTTRNNEALGPKRLEIICELVPRAKLVAFLVNANTLIPLAAAVGELDAAARSIGRQIAVFDVGTERDVDAAFATMERQRIDALVVSGAARLSSWQERIASLAARHAIPAIYSNREFALAGGLISYGPTLYDHFRVAGTYVGRILKGEKPSDLPVQLPTRFEMVLNLKAAKALGLNIPLTLHVAATEVIE
jgi:putative ABC transport system substrate-binding protein